MIFMCAAHEVVPNNSFGPLQIMTFTLAAQELINNISHRPLLVKG